MATSRTVYDAAALKLRANRPELPDDPNDVTDLERAVQLQWSMDVVVIAKVFAADNPLFSRRRFLAACGSTWTALDKSRVS